MIADRSCGVIVEFTSTVKTRKVVAFRFVYRSDYSILHRMYKIAQLITPILGAKLHLYPAVSSAAVGGYANGIAMLKIHEKSSENANQGVRREIHLSPSKQ